MENFIKKIPHIRKIITLFYPFLFPLFHFFSRILVKFCAFNNYLLMKLDWGKNPHTEWMDHDQDQFYNFVEKGSFFFLERGFFPRLYASNFFFSDKEFKNLKLNKNLNILDLCSGDSYISQKFFFDVSNAIISIDLDNAALQRGRKRLNKNNYMCKNHHFYNLDIEKNKIGDFLKKKGIEFKFDIVLFNAAIEHFKEDQLNFIFFSLKEVMKTKSFISTYTIVEDENNQKYLPDHHEMFFSGKKHLEKVVSKYFKFTKSHHSLFNDRCNIYCIGSDNSLEI